MSNIYIYIYIITHKNIANKVKLKNYGYLGVGYNTELDTDFRDNTGENIASKNANYCELTGQYWISHNSNYQYVGLVHYRRFFYENLLGYFSNKILTADYLEKKLNKYDAVLPRKMNMVCSIYDNYASCHHIEDLDLCGEVIKEKCPEYLDSFQRLKKKRRLCIANMIVARKEIYDDYSNWLFSILNEVESKANIRDYSSYQKRIYGFLSERLLNVYFDHHKEYKILYKPVYQIDEEKNTFATRLHLYLRHIKYQMRYTLIVFLKKLGFKRKKK